VVLFILGASALRTVCQVSHMLKKYGVTLSENKEKPKPEKSVFVRFYLQK
jgi:hypothetical protein